MKVLDDLVAEQQALDDVVAGLSSEAWAAPTPAPGWAVRDQIAHLTYFDGTARLAIVDPDAFKESVTQLFAAGVDYEGQTLFRDLSVAELLSTWRSGRAALAEAAGELAEDTRIPWYGPSMSAKSFVTARLMECWAHGQDVVDAVGGRREATDRLRHIAQLGFITRKWSYVNRGLEVPDADVHVALTAPSGEVWQWGPEDAADVVSGRAEDFCLVVTQRRHVDDTALKVEGEVARDWMEKAQAFAGPPTERPRP
jgi:uncharacterized protein (TIGR03084 family)